MALTSGMQRRPTRGKATRMTQQPVDSSGKVLTTNPELLKWVAEMAALTKPDRIVWCDGSEEEKKRLTEEAVAQKILEPLNQEKLPGCYLHRSNPNDVARVEQLTFICTPTKDEAGPTNNWMAPEEAYAKLGKLFDGSMKGRTMYVIPYVMGPLGSPLSKVGVELTDSVYVVLNMRIMTRMGAVALDMLGDSERLQPRPALARSTATPSAASSATSRRTTRSGRVGSRLRRQRAARQEVPRAAHRQLPRQARRAGSPSTCSSSASRAPRAR